MRASRIVGIVTAALVATGGYVHWCLYRHGYRAIPKIGVGFLLQAISSLAVALLLLAGPAVAARAAHVPERLAAISTQLVAFGLAAGTLVAFALTRTSAGLFNFREEGLQPAPRALIALVAESGVLLVSGGALLAVAVRSHHRGTPQLRQV